MHILLTNIKRIGFGVAICLLITGCGTQNVQSDIAADESVQEETKQVYITADEEETADVKTEETVEENTEQTAMASESAEEQSAEVEIPALRDCVTPKLDCYIGCAVTQSELADPEVWRLVTTHFNAVTFGNELKPDCLFGYSVSDCPGTVEDELNGETIIVPVMDFSKSESMLKKFLKWNEENPDRIIKIRGHVLVWHSQTPEWFFHEDYDKKKPYVDKATMDRRQEWYIKTVLTHFTGEDSPYKDLFYGWDVVNEAISDGSGTYRTDAENPAESLSMDRHGSNSSWWHVYQSEEYIINAFKYANKYAPAELELYYNDYNDCTVSKRNGICELLTAVKTAEGEPGVGTRISAMGMQGHYSMEQPSATAVETSMKTYGKIVGNVQITELDISASDSYDGSDESKELEYEKLRKRYNMLYFSMCAGNDSADANLTCITFWGTVDKYSWLQNRSDVGGGSSKTRRQCPLLFDDFYQPKSCFWVFTK